MADPAPQRGFFRALFHSQDASADSLIFGGLIALFVLCALQIFTVTWQGKEFGPWSFASACGTILGAIGGAKTVRDRWAGPAERPPEKPDAHA